MEIELERRAPVGNATPGQLFVDGHPQCGSLERVAVQIQAGRYRVILANSPRFGPDTLTLIDVPGRTHILIHALNRPEESDGCIGVGHVAGSAILGGTSRPALAALKAKILAAILTRREQVWITVRNPPGLPADRQEVTK